MSTVTTYLNLVKPAPLENFSRATYNTNLDLIDASAVTLNKQARGILYRFRNTSPTGAIGSTQTVVKNIPTFNFKGGRKYRIQVTFAYTGSVSNLYGEALVASCAVADAAGAISGLTGWESFVWATTQGGFGQTGYVDGYFEPGSDQDLQIKFTWQVVAGAGTHVITKYNVMIYDEGAQF